PDNSHLAAYARVGEVAGNATASGLSKILSWGEDKFGDYFRSDNVENRQDFFISTPSNSSTPNSVTITQTKPSGNSTNKSSVSISSNDYSKDQLTESSKSLFQSEGKNLV